MIGKVFVKGYPFFELKLIWSFDFSYFVERTLGWIPPWIGSNSQEKEGKVGRQAPASVVLASSIH